MNKVEKILIILCILGISAGIYKIKTDRDQVRAQIATLLKGPPMNFTYTQPVKVIRGFFVGCTGQVQSMNENDKTIYVTLECEDKVNKNLTHYPEATLYANDVEIINETGEKQ